MKRLLILALAVLLLAGCAQMSAEEIAKKVNEKYNAIKDMKGTAVITVVVNGHRSVNVIRFAMKKPNYFWQDTENYTMVSNGKVMWFYDKRKNVVTEFNLPKRLPKFDYGEFVKVMMENSNVKLLGTERVAGRDCYVVEATPKTANLSALFTREKLWIDKEYWYPLRIEMTSKHYRMTIEYKNLTFNTGILDSFFEFKPPAGAKVVKQKLTPPKKLTLDEAQREVNFTIITPKYTAGFKFKYAYVLKFDGKETVLLWYEKDGQRLTIRESVGVREMPLRNSTTIDIGNTKFTMAKILDINILTFRRGEVNVTVSAKLPRDELLKIGESMVE